MIARMKVLLSNYLGDYSCSFWGSSDLVSITVTLSFSSRMQLQEIILLRNIPLRNSQEISAVTVTRFNCFEFNM